MDANTMATVAVAGVGAAGTATVWAVRTYVDSRVATVRAQLVKHEATDEVIHKHVSDSLADIKSTTSATDGKVDRLIERLL